MLASRLARYAGRPDVIVLGLPRGGIPVAFEVAQALGAPLDVFVVRKLGVPGHEELAMGALAAGGLRVLNAELVSRLGVSDEEIASITSREADELARRERAYRGNRPPLDVAGKTVIIVDDGLATGATMHAAVAALRERAPARIVVAVPTAEGGIRDEFRHEVDEVVCAMTPDPFVAVGLWYVKFDATTDDEVRALLARAPEETRP